MNMQIGHCPASWQEFSDQMKFRPFVSLSVSERSDIPPDLISQRPAVCPQRTSPLSSPELQFLTAAAGFEKTGVDRFSSNCMRTFNSSHSRRVIRPQPRMARIDALAPRIYNHDVGRNYLGSVSAARASSPLLNTSTDKSKEKDLHSRRTNDPSITLESPLQSHALKSSAIAPRMRPPHLCMTSLVSRSAYLVDKTCLTLNRYCRVAYAHGQIQQHPNHQTTLALGSSSLSFPPAQSKKLFGCPQCRYLTDRKNNLKRHVLTMHQECTKNLECCGISFRNKASLRDHVLIFHSGGYMCRYCGRNFCRKALLKRHLSVHSGQKDFVCSLCDYATSHKSNLERHKKVHERCSDTLRSCHSGDNQHEESSRAHDQLCDCVVFMRNSRNFPFMCNVNGKVSTTLGMPCESVERVGLFASGLTDSAVEDSLMKASSVQHAMRRRRRRSDQQELDECMREHNKNPTDTTEHLGSDDVDDDDDGRSTASEFINVVDLVG